MSQAGFASLVAVPNVPTEFVEDSGTATPALNQLNILGGTGAYTTGAFDTVTIAVIGAGYYWQSVTSADNPVLFTPSYGYISKGAATVQFNLPVTAAVGDIFRIEGMENLWTLGQNAAQSIKIGLQTTTVGVGGSISATVATDSLTVLCVTTDLEFKVIDWNGNPTVI